MVLSPVASTISPNRGGAKKRKKKCCIFVVSPYNIILTRESQAMNTSLVGWRGSRKLLGRPVGRKGAVPKTFSLFAAMSIFANVSAQISKSKLRNFITRIGAWLREPSGCFPLKPSVLVNKRAPQLDIFLAYIVFFSFWTFMLFAVDKIADHDPKTGDGINLNFRGEEHQGIVIKRTGME